MFTKHNKFLILAEHKNHNTFMTYFEQPSSYDLKRYLKKINILNNSYSVLKFDWTKNVNIIFFRIAINISAKFQYKFVNFQLKFATKLHFSIRKSSSFKFDRPTCVRLWCAVLFCVTSESEWQRTYNPRGE